MIKRKRQAISILLGLCLALSVQTFAKAELTTIRGSGQVVEKSYQVSNFTGVSLKTLGNLYIEMGDEEGLRIEAEDNLIPYLEIKVVDGVLAIGQRAQTVLRPSRPVHFHLLVKELDTVILASSGTITVPHLETDRLSVALLGSGDMELGNLHADAIEARLSGSGGLGVLAGQVKEQQITILGSGDYQAANLNSASAKLRITGSGSMHIQVHEHLQAAIIGSGSIGYLGNPQTRQLNVTGSGSIWQLAATHSRPQDSRVTPSFPPSSTP